LAARQEVADESPPLGGPERAAREARKVVRAEVLTLDGGQTFRSHSWHKRYFGTSAKRQKSL
jgi:hypothetical protein